MRTKILALFLLIFFCVSCDVSTPIVIDGQEEYTLSGTCGTIKIRGSSFTGIPVWVSCTFYGQYHINTDLLKMKVIPDSVGVIDLCFEYEFKDCTGTEIDTNTGETLTMRFDLRSKTETPFFRTDATILILPSDFITCNGKPMITDTITVLLRK